MLVWIWIHWDQKAKGESFGKVISFPLIQLSKVSNFTQFHSIHQTNNQTIKHSYLFNITFQNLEFWDVTNLPHLKWISSSRFEEASKKRVGVGGLLARVLVRKVRGATTLKKKQGHGSNKLRYFLWRADNVCLFTYLTIAPSLKLFCQKHRVFLKSLGRFVKVEVRPRLDLLSW